MPKVRGGGQARQPQAQRRDPEPETAYEQRKRRAAITSWVSPSMRAARNLSETREAAVKPPGPVCPRLVPDLARPPRPIGGHEAATEALKQMLRERPSRRGQSRERVASARCRRSERHLAAAGARTLGRSHPDTMRPG